MKKDINKVNMPKQLVEVSTQKSKPQDKPNSLNFSTETQAA